MNEKISLEDADALLKKHLAPGQPSQLNAWGSAPASVSAQIEAICQRVDELTKADRTAIEQAPEEALEKLKTIYDELIAVAKKVRALETTGEQARSEHDLQMDLEREAQRRRKF